MLVRKTGGQCRIGDLEPACCYQRVTGGYIPALEKYTRSIVAGVQGDTGFFTAVQTETDETDRLFDGALKDDVPVHRYLLLLGVSVE